MVVLDRPNPVGGVAVQGNVPATARPVERVGDFLPVPMRHGMTMGEVTRLANDVFGMRARLTVVPAAGGGPGGDDGGPRPPWGGPAPHNPGPGGGPAHSPARPPRGRPPPVGRGAP